MRIETTSFTSKLVIFISETLLKYVLQCLYPTRFYLNQPYTNLSEYVFRIFLRKMYNIRQKF